MTPGADSSEAQVILQLENELLELRNACAWKDQRIAELSRTDAPVARLKRDIRLLAMELHHTRKELSESMRDLQDLQAQLARGESGGSGGRDSAAVPQRDIVDSPATSAGAPATATSGGAASGASGASGSDRGAQLRGRIAELQDENRQLREKVVSLQTRQNGLAVEVTRDNSGSFEGSLHHARQPSGAASQRAVELNQAVSATPPSAYSSIRGTAYSGTGAAAPGGASPTGSTVTPPPAAALAQATPANAAAPGGAVEEPVRPVVYSSVDHTNQSTLGPTTLQGVGVVDGVASVAKVLLQRIHSSVCAAHRRPQMALPTPAVQPGQMPLVPQVSMPQGNI